MIDRMTPGWTREQLEGTRQSVADGRQPMTVEIMAQIVRSSAADNSPWMMWEDQSGHREKALAPWLEMARPDWLPVLWTLLSAQEADDDNLLAPFAYDLVECFPKEAAQFLGPVVSGFPRAERGRFPFRFAISLIGDGAQAEAIEWLEPLVGDETLSEHAVVKLGVALAIIPGARARTALEALRASSLWSFPDRDATDRLIETILAAKPAWESPGA